VTIARTAAKTAAFRFLLATIAALAASAPVLAQTQAPGLNLEQYKGRVVYLDFWASWCGPCKLSFPYMERMTSVYSRRPFVVIAVNVDHSRVRADAFLSQVGASVPIIYDPKGVIATKFHVTEMPTSILIGRDGRVRYVHQGFFQDKTPLYEAHIEELLSEK
jgi:thiol-disulfide isomerase/thioredoxin